MKNRSSLILTLFVLSANLPIFAGGACSKGANTARVAPVPNPQPAPAPVPQLSRASRSEPSVPPALPAPATQAPAQLADQDAKKAAAKKPLHFNEIYEEIEDPNRFESEFKKLAEYYGNGDLANSQYMKDVEQKCQEARKYFETISPGKNSIVVFDIDDTLLTRVPNHYSLHIKSLQNHAKIGCDKPCCKHPQSDQHIALAPVLELWNYCIARGWTPALVTNTRRSMVPFRLRCLKEAGYTVPGNTPCLGVPDHVYEQIANLQGEQLASQVAIMKLGARTFLTKQGCTIDGSVGDFETDHYCACEEPHAYDGCPYSGYKVKLPNKLVELRLPQAVKLYQKSRD